MNQDSVKEIGGVSITPSARPSIHNHSGGCTFLPGERARSMGTYAGHDDSTDEEPGTKSSGGITRRATAGSPANTYDQASDHGRDEVDNVQSKLVQGPSPLNARRIGQKRNSFEFVRPCKDDSDCSSKLAISLPTYLRSPYSLSSNEFGNFSSPNHSNISTDSSKRNTSFPKPYSASNNVSMNESISPSNRPQIRGEEPQSWSLVLLFGLLSAIAVIIAIYYGTIPSIPEMLSVSNNYNKAKFFDDLKDLSGKYDIGVDSILQLQTGISTIFKREDTGSFVLAYKSNNRDFDRNAFNNLVNIIALTAAKFLRNDSTSVQHIIVVDGSKLEMRSHSELINKYRDDFTKTGVMLVREIDEVPSNLAMAFHYYCDEYNPLAKKSAIFFTLDMTKCSHIPTEQDPSYAQIEKCLKKKWSGVPKDNIGPLLNRVVSSVIDVAGK